MTREDMNCFLLSIGGLNSGYSKDADPITDCYFFEVGEGWYLLIKDLIVELIDTGWDKNIQQVKEKFGGLRFYADGSANMDVIHKYMDLSTKTCEVCGKPGVRRNKDWIRTLCDEHNSTQS